MPNTLQIPSPMRDPTGASFGQMQADQSDLPLPYLKT